MSSLTFITNIVIASLSYFTRRKLESLFEPIAKLIICICFLRYFKYSSVLHLYLYCFCLWCLNTLMPNLLNRCHAEELVELSPLLYESLSGGYKLR